MKFYLIIFPLINFFPVIIYPEESGSRSSYFICSPNIQISMDFSNLNSCGLFVMLIKSVDYCGTINGLSGMIHSGSARTQASCSWVQSSTPALVFLLMVIHNIFLGLCLYTFLRLLKSFMFVLSEMTKLEVIRFLFKYISWRTWGYSSPFVLLRYIDPLCPSQDHRKGFWVVQEQILLRCLKSLVPPALGWPCNLEQGQV